MTKPFSIVKNEMTYEQLLHKHLDALDEDQRNEKVTGAMVVATSEHGPFYTVLKSMSVLECIGLLEHLKHFLIETDMYGEE
jgi:hypothetical protein